MLWFTKNLAQPSLRSLFPFTMVDLTHGLSSSIPTWDGIGGFEQAITYDYGDIGFRIQRTTMNAGIGTHIDAPSHMVQGGLSIDALSLDHLVVPCVVVDVSQKADERYRVCVEDIHVFEREFGRIPRSSFVIIRTGWDRFWDSAKEYRNNLVFPSVSEEVARLLLDREISGLGIDTLSPDRPEDGFCVHKALLGAQKYIVENVANAGLLPPVGCYSICLPIKIEDGTEAPVRLIALCRSRLTGDERQAVETKSF